MGCGKKRKTFWNKSNNQYTFCKKKLFLFFFFQTLFTFEHRTAVTNDHFIIVDAVILTKHESHQFPQERLFPWHWQWTHTIGVFVHILFWFLSNVHAEHDNLWRHGRHFVAEAIFVDSIHVCSEGVFSIWFTVTRVNVLAVWANYLKGDSFIFTSAAWLICYIYQTKD